MYERLLIELAPLPDDLGGLGRIPCHLARLEVRRQELQQACPHLQEGIRQMEAVLKTSAPKPEYLEWLCNHDWYLADVLTQTNEYVGRAQAALNSYQAAHLLSRAAAQVLKNPKLSPGQGQQRAQYYADLAMARLTQAVNQGYNDFDHIKHDATWDLLRARADFIRLTERNPKTPIR
jgi:hypothetical protein